MQEKNDLEQLNYKLNDLRTSLTKVLQNNSNNRLTETL